MEDLLLSFQSTSLFEPHHERSLLYLSSNYTQYSLSQYSSDLLRLKRYLHFLSNSLPSNIIHDINHFLLLPPLHPLCLHLSQHISLQLLQLL